MDASNALIMQQELRDELDYIDLIVIVFKGKNTRYKRIRDYKNVKKEIILVLVLRTFLKYLHIMILKI